MADDKKKQEDKQKKHAHGEGPVTDAKAHAEAKKAGGGGGKKKGARDQKGPKTIQAAEGKAASRGEHPARLGIAYKEQIIFPEINYDRIEKIKGMNITIVTTARSDEEGRALLRYFGMPFRTA